MNKIKTGMLLGGMFFALAANASVTGFTSGVESVSDLGDGYNATHPGTENDNTVVFQEQYSFQLGSDLVTDTGGTIGAGTYIGSYLVNYSPVGTGPRSAGLQEISFSDEILGVIYTTSGLNATDGMLGHSNVSYSTNTYGWRGLEGNDTVNFTGMTVAQLLNTTNDGIDQMRVITAAPVPLPAAVWMFGAGLLGLVGFARRSASKAV